MKAIGLSALLLVICAASPALGADPPGHSRLLVGFDFGVI